MSNVIDYMDWRGDVAMYPGSFNEVDNIILSMIAYLDFEGIVPGDFEGKPVGLGEALGAFDSAPDEQKYLGLLIPKKALRSIKKVASAPRFGEIGLTGYVNELNPEIKMQFSAITFLLPDDTVYVAYRGTDDTVAGWQEDILLGIRAPVASHVRATEYLEKAAEKYRGKIKVGGHSKGGNLAMWAAAHVCDGVKSRIDCVYNNDGPGVLPEVAESEEYKSVADRIITYTTQSSLFGVILEQSPNCRVIKSRQIGLLQHDPLSWEVKGPEFVHLDERTWRGKRIDEGIDTWIYSMTGDEREKFADILFQIMDSTGAKTLTEFSKSKFKNLGSMMKSFHSLEPKTKEMLLKAMFNLLGGRPADI